RLDYEDFLWQRGLPLWPREDPRRAELIAQRPVGEEAVAMWVQEIHERCGQNERSGLSTVSTSSTKSTYPEIVANAALTLIAVACALLDRQIAAQATSFEAEGGFTERLYFVRSASKKK
ncbi:MAG TPA: four helix bundle suffix domain-containing protein, partial [Geobacteraceae bacterium]|nr:four helix bundle suffix domain-containing protein [Geobacteraceae bacterium]